MGGAPRKTWGPLGALASTEGGLCYFAPGQPASSPFTAQHHYPIRVPEKVLKWKFLERASALCSVVTVGLAFRLPTDRSHPQKFPARPPGRPFVEVIAHQVTATPEPVGCRVATGSTTGPPPRARPLARNPPTR
jgi:hypothetical protein